MRTVLVKRSQQRQWVEPDSVVGGNCARRVVSVLMRTSGARTTLRLASQKANDVLKSLHRCKGAIRRHGFHPGRVPAARPAIRQCPTMPHSRVSYPGTATDGISDSRSYDYSPLTL
jgi:hypothetical protein